MVKIIAHRGFSGNYPENTEIAFVKALSLNVDTIEFDVHLSRDKELIVIHDPTVDRTSDGSGRIEHMTLAEIKALDAGSWFKKEFQEQRFLTLPETLNLIDAKVRLNIHIKTYKQDREKIVSLTIRELKQQKLFRQAYIASDQDSVTLAKGIDPCVEICNLTTEPQDTYISRSLSIGCRILQPTNTQTDLQFVKEAHRRKMEVNAFYANDADEMHRLIECGVDGILTDYPDLLLAVRRGR